MSRPNDGRLGMTRQGNAAAQAMIASTPLRIAVLDDFQKVALRCGDWSLIPDAQVTAFSDHIDDPAALAERLAPFQVVCLMRERTRVPAVVSEVALIRALRSKRIAGAGLDVFDTEPLPADHPLRCLPGTIVTLHIGYVTERNYAYFYTQVIENICAWVAGSPIRTLVTNQLPRAA